MLSKIKTVLKHPGMAPAYAAWCMRPSRRVHGFSVGNFATFGDYWNVNEISPSSEEMAFIRSLPRGPAIDVGANIGVWAACLHGLGFNVHCFEPIPDTFDRLMENCPQCAANMCAVSDKIGLATMTGHTRANALNKLCHNGDVNVRTTTLDAYCAKMERIALIKIDVEGAEALVLRGAEQTLKKTSALIIEKNSDDILPLLSDYRISRISERNIVAVRGKSPTP